MAMFPMGGLLASDPKNKQWFDVLTLPNGDLLASESTTHQIWLISADFKTMSVFAGKEGPGSKDGKILEAQFNWPTSMELMSDGTLIIADQGNHRIRTIDPTRSHVRTLAGSSLGYVDGPCATAKFNYCISICISNDDSIFVSDHMNHRIRKIDMETKMVTTIAGNGALGYINDEDMLRSSFNSPAGIKFDLDGCILLADGGNHCIRKIDVVNKIVSTVCGIPLSSGFVDGDITEAKFNKPLLVTTDSVGNLYVSDYNNSKVRFVDLREGVISTISKKPDGESLIKNPYNIALDLNGNVIIADWGNQKLKRIEARASMPNYNILRYNAVFKNIPLTSFLDDMLRLMNDAKSFHGDFEFIIDGVSVFVHKAIISVRSQYFGSMLSSGMRESSENKLVLKETNLVAFKEVIRYIYTDSLDFSPEVVCDVMVLADRYVLPRLLTHCEQHIKSTVNNSTAVRWFIWADENNISWLKDLTKKRIVNNFGAIRDNNKNTFQMLVEGRPDLMQEIFLS